MSAKYTAKQYFEAGFIEGQKTCNCNTSTRPTGRRNTKDQDEFPSFYLDQQNEEQAHGSEGFGAYKRLWGKSKTPSINNNLNAYEQLWGRSR
jgi:hypothetical protein